LFFYGAATAAAANIAESVGSLFGINKVKTLERENTALHREVADHEETIEALQDRIQTMQAATLVKGKPLEYAGELYSEEHGRKFTTERAGFQVLKDPTDGTRLVLAIDRKSIAEWFKEQFDKLRQNIRRPIQPQRKSKGFKL